MGTLMRKVRGWDNAKECPASGQIRPAGFGKRGPCPVCGRTVGRLGSVLLAPHYKPEEV